MVKVNAFNLFQVTLLLSYFSEAEIANQSTDKQRFVDFINMYNRRFSGEPLSVSCLLAYLLLAVVVEEDSDF